MIAGTDHAAEIEITLAPADQGRGCRAEAVTALVDAVFAAGRHKVVAYVDVRNARSLVLFDRLGFRREGLLHHSFKRADGLIDEVLFGLTADLWRHPTEGTGRGARPASGRRGPAGRRAVRVQRRGHRRRRRDRWRCSSATSSQSHRRGSGRRRLGRGAELWLVWVREDRRRKRPRTAPAGRVRGRRPMQGRADLPDQPHVPGADFYKRFGYTETGGNVPGSRPVTPTCCWARPLVGEGPLSGKGALSGRGADAEVTVVGGGAIGCAVLYHLAEAGYTDLQLVEAGELASATSSQAAGLVEQVRTTPERTALAIASVALFGRLQRDHRGRSTGVRPAASASPPRPKRVAEFDRMVAVARSQGLEVELLGPAEVAERCPVLETGSVQAACGARPTATSSRTASPPPTPRRRARRATIAAAYGSPTS